MGLTRTGSFRVTTTKDEQSSPRRVLGGLKRWPGLNRDIVALTILGLLARLAWVSVGPWTAGDTRHYLILAKNIAVNHVFSLDESGPPFSPTFARPPLYPTFIAAFWWGDSAPVFPVLVAQAILGALTVALVYLIARDSFSRMVALVAAAGMALGPMSGRYSASLLTEALFTFLITLGFFLWGRKRPAWTGVAFGLAALTRPTMTPFLCLLILLALLPRWRAYRRDLVTIVLVTLAVVAPWVIRNAVVFKQFIPVTTAGYGASLLYGTMEMKLVGDEFCCVITDPANRMEPGETYMDAAIRRIKADPLHWLSVRARQYPRLFMDSGDYLLGPRNVLIGQAVREGRWLVILTKVAFILGNLLFFGLAAFGIYVERKRFVSLAHITLFPIFLALIHLPMWIESRYAVPMVPLVAILSAAGLMRLVEILRRRQRGISRKGAKGLTAVLT